MFSEQMSLKNKIRLLFQLTYQKTKAVLYMEMSRHNDQNGKKIPYMERSRDKDQKRCVYK